VKVIINSETAKNYAIKLLEDVDITANQELSIQKHSLTRSAAQRSFQWMLYTDMQNTDINEHSGTTKEEHHHNMKREFLVNIYSRDDPCGYGVMINNMRNYYLTGAKVEAEFMFDKIVDLTSTTTATVEQFTEYLECVMRWCNTRGISYRMPQDIYSKAIGK